MTGTSDETHGRAGRLVLFHADDPFTEGRRLRRARILEMRPIDPTDEVLPARESAGVMHWEYLQSDDSALLIRASDFSDADEARWDADRLFARTRPLRTAFVRDAETGHLSWWLVRGPEILLVPSRVWLTSQRAAVVSHVRRAASVLRGTPHWGAYTG